MQGFFDVTLSYGARYRTEDADKDLVAIPNGGRSTNANTDDGTLNYKRGLVSSMATANAELTLSWENIGLFAKSVAFYD